MSLAIKCNPWIALKIVWRKRGAINTLGYGIITPGPSSVSRDMIVRVVEILAKITARNYYVLSIDGINSRTYTHFRPCVMVLIHFDIGGNTMINRSLDRPPLRLADECLHICLCRQLLRKERGFVLLCHQYYIILITISLFRSDCVSCCNRVLNTASCQNANDQSRYHQNANQTFPMGKKPFHHYESLLAIHFSSAKMLLA